MQYRDKLPRNLSVHLRGSAAHRRRGGMRGPEIMAVGPHASGKSARCKWGLVPRARRQQRSPSRT